MTRQRQAVRMFYPCSSSARPVSHWCASCSAVALLPVLQVRECMACEAGLLAPSRDMARFLLRQQRRFARLSKKLAAGGFQLRQVPGGGLPGWAVFLGFGSLAITRAGKASGKVAPGWPSVRLRGLDGVAAFKRLMEAGHVC